MRYLFHRTTRLSSQEFQFTWFHVRSRRIFDKKPTQGIVCFANSFVLKKVTANQNYRANLQYTLNELIYEEIWRRVLSFLSRCLTVPDDRVALWWHSWLFLRLPSRCVRYNNRRSELPSTQLLCVILLILQLVSTSEGYLQASCVKYIKGIVYNYIQPLYAIVHHSFYVLYTIGLKITLWGRNTLQNGR